MSVQRQIEFSTSHSCRQEFRVRLKDSLVDRDVAVGDEDDLPASLEEIVNQMQWFNKAINAKKRQSIYHYMLMGRNMDAVKNEKDKKLNH